MTVSRRPGIVAKINAQIDTIYRINVTEPYPMKSLLPQISETVARLNALVTVAPKPPTPQFKRSQTLLINKLARLARDWSAQNRRDPK